MNTFLSIHVGKPKIVVRWIANTRFFKIKKRISINFIQYNFQKKKNQSSALDFQTEHCIFSYMVLSVSWIITFVNKRIQWLFKELLVPESSSSSMVDINLLISSSQNPSFCKTCLYRFSTCCLALIWKKIKLDSIEIFYVT